MSDEPHLARALIVGFRSREVIQVLFYLVCNRKQVRRALLAREL
jgi:hypothetical protein